MRTPFVFLVLVPAALAQANLTLNVNDPKSHGTLSDTKLSFDEAIQLNNGTLLLSQLSQAERSQISGLGSTIERIVIDAAVTPVITYEKNLTPISRLAHAHAEFFIDGKSGPTGRPVLDAVTFDAALPIVTNHAHIGNFSLRNGKAGITYDTTGHFHPSDRAEFHEMDLEGQTEAGFKFTAPASPAGQTVPAVIHDIRMKNLPVGYRIEDRATNGTLTCTSEHVHLENVKIGVDLFVSATGGTSFVEFFRSDMVGSETCLRMRRDPGSDSEMLVRFTIGTYTATKNVFDVQGSTLGNTIVHHHHNFMRAGSGAGDYALTVSPRTARFDVHGSENVIEGNMAVLASRSTRRLWVHNSIFRNGSLTLDYEGVQPEILWNIFESYPVNVLATGRTPVLVDSCELVRSPVNGASTFGPVTLRNCFADSSPTTGSVTVTAPAPARWLGQASVTPRDPLLGTFVDLLLDYQPDMGAVWLLSIADPRPTTTNFPFRFYLKLNPLIVIQSLHTLRDRVRLPIPNDATLAGVELYAQPLNLPLKGQTYVPGVTLPRGGYFKITK